MCTSRCKKKTNVTIQALQRALKCRHFLKVMFVTSLTLLQEPVDLISRPLHFTPNNRLNLSPAASKFEPFVHSLATKQRICNNHQHTSTAKMLHQDGFKILVQHQNELLQEYDSIDNSDPSENILHVGNYTARHSRFYIVPNKAGSHRMMTITFVLQRNFDFQDGNIVHLTMKISGTAQSQREKSQLIWKHKLAKVKEPFVGLEFDWRASMLQDESSGGSGPGAEDATMVITIERGRSDIRWEEENRKARKAFEPVSGENHVVEIRCRLFEKRQSQSSNPDVLGGSNGSRMGDEGDVERKDKQPVDITPEDDSSRTASLAERTTPARSPSPDVDTTDVQRPASVDLPSLPTPTPTPTPMNPTSTSTATPSTNTIPHRPKRKFQPEDASEDASPIKQETADAIDLTQQPDENEDDEDILCEIKDKELELKQSQLEIDKIKAERALNALRNRRLKRHRVLGSPFNNTGASSPVME